MNNKVTFFVMIWAYGGIEKMLVRLANQLSRLGYSVEIVVFRRIRRQKQVLNESFKLELLPDVSFVFLDIPRISHLVNVYVEIYHIIKYLMQKKPFIVFTNTMGGNAITANFLSPVKTNVCIIEHATISSKFADRLIVFLFYPFAMHVICVALAMKKQFQEIMPFHKNRVSTIMNPVVSNSLHKKAQMPVAHPWLQNKTKPVFLSVGRLEKEKDLPNLLKAFAIARETLDACLIIAGQGTQKEYLEKLALTLGVGEYTDFIGFVENPYPLYLHSDVFVLPSQYEGFALVLVEAMACGCQVVSTDCPTGPSEVLQDGSYGWLVPVKDEKAMASAMIDAIKHPMDRNLLTERANVFSVEASAEKYVQLIESLRHPQNESNT